MWYRSTGIQINQENGIQIFAAHYQRKDGLLRIWYRELYGKFCRKLHKKNIHRLKELIL